MEITEKNNFMRIFRVPNDFPSDFCFGGGHPVNFQMVDWFNPIPLEEFWDNPIKSLGEKEAEEYRGAIREFIKIKNYYNGDFKFLALSNYGDAFFI